MSTEEAPKLSSKPFKPHVEWYGGRTAFKEVVEPLFGQEAVSKEVDKQTDVMSLVERDGYDEHVV